MRIMSFTRIWFRTMAMNVTFGTLKYVDDNNNTSIWCHNQWVTHSVYTFTNSVDSSLKHHCARCGEFARGWIPPPWARWSWASAISSRTHNLSVVAHQKTRYTFRYHNPQIQIRMFAYNFPESEGILARRTETSVGSSGRVRSLSGWKNIREYYSTK